jgi:hypothetical protein
MDWILDYRERIGFTSMEGAVACAHGRKMIKRECQGRPLFWVSKYENATFIGLKDDYEVAFHDQKLADVVNGVEATIALHEALGRTLSGDQGHVRAHPFKGSRLLTQSRVFVVRGLSTELSQYVSMLFQGLRSQYQTKLPVQPANEAG